MASDRPGATSPPDSPSVTDLRRWQVNLDGEIDGIAVYGMLAAAEKDPERRSIFEELAAVEERHANVWRIKLRDAGVAPREHGPSFKVRMVGRAAKLFGVNSVLGIVRALEADAYSVYMLQDATAQAMAPDERMHQETLDRMMSGKRAARGTSASEAAASKATSPDGAIESIAQRESWHRRGGGGTLRATVFGVSDGLVSNTALVMGFAGASTDGSFILLAGISGLLAGAFSMAAGEYVSVRAQRELFERQIALEREELIAAPEEEKAELTIIYRAKGLDTAEAESLATHIMENPDVALDTLVREELGLDQGELGSPWGAAISSFIAFSLGAIVPVIPFVFADASWPYVLASCLLSATALFGVGAALSLFTGKSMLYSGVRQVALGALAAAATYGIGKAVGVSTGV